MHILLDEARYQKVMREAQRRGISVGAVIRQAIDDLPIAQEQRRSALERILAAEPMPVPADPTELRDELNRAHERS